MTGRWTRYQGGKQLFYSDIFGRGVYEWRGQFVPDPLGNEEGVSPLLINALSGERFFLKRIDYKQKEKKKCHAYILSPPDRQIILWPTDLISLSEEQQNLCGIFVAQEYAPKLTAAKNRKGRDAMLFPYDGYPTLVSGVQKLNRIKDVSWKNKEVQAMAAQIAFALEELNRTGYFYADMHLSRFFFADSAETAYLNYSPLIFPKENPQVGNTGKFYNVREGEYPVEFGDPALEQKIIPGVDYASQNYSLCALLFYLFLGRYPYDGRLLAGRIDDDLQKHYDIFWNYHKMPIFIFDPLDRQNRLVFREDQPVTELWLELPRPVRDLFIDVLRRENAERTQQVDNPSPKKWLQIFRQLGWIKY